MAKKTSFNTKALFFSDRLDELMMQVYDFPLTVVEAPMGYGKTTAVRAYLEKSKAVVLWQTVHDGFSDTFWNNFCGLFSDLDSGCSQGLAALGLPNDSVTRYEALRLVETLKLKTPTVIVIDDYFMIDQEALHIFLDVLVRSEIENLHIIITTRLVLMPNLEELKLKGYAQHVTKEFLELTPVDILKYFKTCGVLLKVEEAEQLHMHTEGWISALYLYLLDTAKNGVSKSGSGILRIGENADIYSLMGTAVYGPLPDELRTFLLTMCNFESFTAEQAVYMWNSNNTHALLDALMSRNIFITYDRKNRTYQVHNILSIFLKDVFEQRDSSYQYEIFRRAMQWHLESGNHLAAMEFAYRSGDFESLLKTIEIDKGHSITQEHTWLFDNYFGECPLEIKWKHPLALLIYAINLFISNDMLSFEVACGQFMEAIQRNDELNKVDRNRLLGEFELLLSFTEYNDILKMSEHHQKAYALLKGPAAFLNTKECWTFGSPSVLYMFCKPSITLEKAVQDMKDSMPWYYKLTNGHGKGAEFIFEAERYFNRCEFEKAEISAHQGLYASNHDEQSVIRLCAHFLLMRIALIKGEHGYVTALIEELRREIHSKKLYHLIYTLDMCEGYVHALMKQPKKIPLWISEGDFNGTRLPFPAIGFSNIIYGRSLIITGNHLKLLGISEQMLGVASVFQNMLAIIYTLIYAAAANELIHRRTEAAERLKEALAMAAPDWIIMPFVENCDFIGSLLERIAATGSNRLMICEIQERYAVYKGSISPVVAFSSSGKGFRLSEREKEIAALAAEGLSNKEIGEVLFISQNTVKTQMKSIFEKLGISSRALLKQRLENASEQVS